MAWTAPRTWVAFENVTASIMNTHVRDNLSHIGGMVVGDFALSALSASAKLGAHIVRAGGSNNDVEKSTNSSSYTQLWNVSLDLNSLTWDYVLIISQFKAKKSAASANEGFYRLQKSTGTGTLTEQPISLVFQSTSYEKAITLVGYYTGNAGTNPTIDIQGRVVSLSGETVFARSMSTVWMAMRYT